MYCLIPEYQSPFLIFSPVKSSCRCSAASRVSTGVVEGVGTGVGAGVVSTIAVGLGVGLAMALGLGEGVARVVSLGLGEGVSNVVLVGLGVAVGWNAPGPVNFETKKPPSPSSAIRIIASAATRRIPVTETRGRGVSATGKSGTEVSPGRESAGGNGGGTLV